MQFSGSLTVGIIQSGYMAENKVFKRVVVYLGYYNITMAGKVFKWSKKEEKYTMFVDDDCEEQEYTDESFASDNDNMEDLEDIANGHMEERRDDDSDMLSGESDENSELSNSKRKLGPVISLALSPTSSSESVSISESEDSSSTPAFKSSAGSKTEKPNPITLSDSASPKSGMCL